MGRPATTACTVTGERAWWRSIAERISWVVATSEPSFGGISARTHVRRRKRVVAGAHAIAVVALASEPPHRRPLAERHGHTVDLRTVGLLTATVEQHLDGGAAQLVVRKREGRKPRLHP